MKFNDMNTYIMHRLYKLNAFLKSDRLFHLMNDQMLNPKSHSIINIHRFYWINAFFHFRVNTPDSSRYSLLPEDISVSNFD